MGGTCFADKHEAEANQSLARNALATFLKRGGHEPFARSGLPAPAFPGDQLLSARLAGLSSTARLDPPVAIMSPSCAPLCPFDDR
jgi:hypothetical protein